MRHSVIDLSGGRGNLSGGIPGRKLLSAFIAATPPADAPMIVFLDFKGIEIATASFLREAVVSFRDYARLSLSNVYPAVANLAPEVREELDFFLRTTRDALWACDLDSSNHASQARLIGELDPAQRATFDAMLGKPATTATELATLFADQSIGPTAWNNRLSGLAAKGLVVERRSGKTKSFSPLLEIA
jgi:hypothetical protein